ncbi:MAG: hypothetical protein V3U96_07410 [Paracoccaceae bacterium]
MKLRHIIAMSLVSVAIGSGAIAGDALVPAMGLEELTIATQSGPDAGSMVAQIFLLLLVIAALSVTVDAPVISEG